MVNEKRKASRCRRLVRLFLAMAICLALGTPSALHLTHSVTASAQVPCALAAEGVCVVPSPIPESGYVLDCTTGTLPICPDLVTGDAQLVLAVIGPAESDPVSALQAAASGGLPGAPTPDQIEQFYLSQASVTGSTLPLSCPGCMTNGGGGNFTDAYAALEYCSNGPYHCDAWYQWVKGTIRFNGYTVGQASSDYTDCPGNGAPGYSVDVTWCGNWNNWATYSTSPNYTDLGVNWKVTCCYGSNAPGYTNKQWARIDVQPSGYHNFRGGSQ